MRLFVISLLALVATVHPYAINSFPSYKSALLSYSPARGEFPVQSGLATGYVRYYDANGAEKLLPYSYPEPLYGIRQLSYDGSGLYNPLLKTANYQPAFYSGYPNYYWSESKEMLKAREENFRVWCEQRYNVLKMEIDRIRAEGKEPTTDMMAQFRPLEMIVKSTAPFIAYTAFGETAEVKQAREEHMRIWNEARLKVLQLEAEELKRQGMKPAEFKPVLPMPMSGDFELKAYAPAFNPVAPIGETLEQKLAREEHMRIYNEQLLRIKQLEAAQQAESATALKTAFVAPIIAPLFEANKETPEVFRAKEEHLRLWNEAKLRAEQAPEKPAEYVPKPAAFLIKSTATPVAFIPETAEVERAREEHLKLVEAAKLKVQTESINVEYDDGSYKPAKEDGSYKPMPLETPVLKMVPAVQQPQKPEAVVLKSSFPIVQLPTETPEVIRAREEHLQLVKTAQLKEASPIVNYLPTTEAVQEVERMEEVEAERLREAERMRSEEKSREEERLREMERLAEEERMMAAERVRLLKDEEQRMEMERLAEVKRMQTEEFARQQDALAVAYQNIAAQPIEGQIKSDFQATVPLLPATPSGDAFILSEVQKNNPYFLRFAGQPDIASTTYIIGDQKPASFYQPAPNTLVNAENPFFLRYTTELKGDNLKSPFESASLITTAIPTAPIGAFAVKSEFKPITTDIPATADLKVKYNEAVGLSELDKATKEHFRAHEIALERLRLANFKAAIVDC